MNDNQNRLVLDFLKKHKEINKTNVLLLNKEIRENKIYELRAYTEGKLSHLSFGHSVKGWTDQNGVIIPNSKPTRKIQAQKEMKVPIWTKPQQKFLDDMNKKIDDNQTETNKKFELMNQKIDNNHNELKSDINKILEHLKIQ